jgi:hypothetical protein
MCVFAEDGFMILKRCIKTVQSSSFVRAMNEIMKDSGASDLCVFQCAGFEHRRFVIAWS